MINLGDKQISSIKLGSTNVVSVYKGDTLIWPPREPSVLVYTTTSANQSVQLTYYKEYFEYIETEDGVEDLSGTGALNHTFVNVGEHKVKVLFKKGLTNFSHCFYGCYELTSIPSDLFANNSEVTDFSHCFYGCYELTSIPNGLFANNTKVTSFRYCFYGCYELTSIPSDLFANNSEVTDFSHCLQYCRELTSSTPLDNDGTPLYNRSEGKEGYSIVNNHTSCFYRCTLMSDYSSIPSDWK